MTKHKKGMFSGRASRSMEKPSFNYGYLKLPEDVNAFKPEGGTEVTFDIVPYYVKDEKHLDNQKHKDDATVGELWWKKSIRVHRDVGPDGVQIICPTTQGDRCPICEYGKMLRKEGKEWEEVKEIFPKNRTLFFIVPIDASDCEEDYTEGEVHVMDVSDHLFVEALDDEVKADLDYEDFANPWYGFSIKARFKEESLGKVKYASTSRIDFVERAKQYDDEFIDSLPCLDDFIKVLTYEEIQALMDYTGEVDDVAEEEDERPKRKSPKRPAKKQDEPEEVEEVDEVPEEEPEEKPKPKPKPKPKARTPKSKEELVCPHSDDGLEFGVDTDKYDVCDDCKIWKQCNAEFQKRKA